MPRVLDYLKLDQETCVNSSQHQVFPQANRLRRIVA